MKNLIISLLFVSIVSCSFRKEVSREKVGETTTQNVVLDCTHYDYCLTCGPGFGGPQCGYKFSSFCPGHQTAIAHLTPYLVSYDDGSQKTENNISYSNLGECH